MSEKTKQMISLFNSYNLPTFDPYRRVGGSRLMLTSTGHAVREDGQGRVHRIEPTEFVVGRDEHRSDAVGKRQAKLKSKRLAETMLVDRSDCLGKDSQIDSVRSAKRLCQVKFVAGEFVMPAPFVTYETKSGSMLYRKLVQVER